MTDPIRRLAAMVAGQGYVVGVPEVYHEYEPPGTVLRYDQIGTERGNGLKTTKAVAAFDADATSALAYLRQHAACSGLLATLGVCLGGHLAYRAALDPSVSAAACFYPTDIHSGTLGAGTKDDSLARMGDLKAETLFVWGRQDPHVPFAGRKLIRRTAGRGRRALRMARGQCRRTPSCGTRVRATIRNFSFRRSGGRWPCSTGG